MKVKYINFKKLGIVLFSEFNDHAAMARRLGETPISAGFASIPDEDSIGNKISCYGKSVSLNLESTEKDTLELQRMVDPYA